MKGLATLFVLCAASAYGQSPQSISLPKFPAINCDGRIAGSCTYPKVYPNTTGVMMAPATYPGAGTTGVTDSLGNVWHMDACAMDNGGDCLWSANFGPNIYKYGQPDTITIAPNYYNTQGYDSFLFLYDGTWQYTGQSSQGIYRDPSTAPASCQNSAVDCGPGWTWTGLVYAEAGEMMISWCNSRIVASAGFIPKPNPGFYIEATDHTFAIADMIAPVENLYHGSMLWKNPDGINDGVGHWQSAIAVYSRAGS